MRDPSRDLPSLAADVLARVRARAPRVHCITNAVAQNFTANMLLALGAIPSMTIAPEEVAEFAGRADALLINLGTLDAERRAAAEIASAVMGEAARPWVLDPVFVERSAPRTAFARALLAKRPHIVRLNRAEFEALSGAPLNDEALADFARRTGAAVGLTGEADHVTDGARRARIDNGSPLMAKVTAMGCAGTAVIAACHAVESDRWQATVAGLIVLGVAGELAGATAAGPGSFAVGILDAIHALDRDTLIAKARVAR